MILGSNRSWIARRISMVVNVNGVSRSHSVHRSLQLKFLGACMRFQGGRKWGTPGTKSLGPIDWKKKGAKEKGKREGEKKKVKKKEKEEKKEIIFVFNKFLPIYLLPCHFRS
jgi:hypothetical protein